MTITNHRHADLLARRPHLAVTPQRAAQRGTSARRSSPTPGSASTSPTTWSTSAGRSGGGWHRPRVQPYGPIALDPAAAVLHYAPGDLRGAEGLPARRRLDLDVPPRGERRADAALGRAPRAARAADRVLHRVAASSSIAVDGDWVPSAPETSLYLRPFMFAKEAFLGVRPAKKVGYYVIASPAGAYFPGGVAPGVDLAVDEVRPRRQAAAPARPRPAATTRRRCSPQAEAAEKGCAQVLFLDSVEGKYIEELGGMNVVLVYKDGTLVTPESDSILEGITRDSILQLAEDRGHTVERAA